MFYVISDKEIISKKRVSDLSTHTKNSWHLLYIYFLNNLWMISFFLTKFQNLLLWVSFTRKIRIIFFVALYLMPKPIALVVLRSRYHVISLKCCTIHTRSLCDRSPCIIKLSMLPRTLSHDALVCIYAWIQNKITNLSNSLFFYR